MGIVQRGETKSQAKYYFINIFRERRDFYFMANIESKKRKRSENNVE